MPSLVKPVLETIDSEEIKETKKKKKVKITRNVKKKEQHPQTLPIAPPSASLK